MIKRKWLLKFMLVTLTACLVFGLMPGMVGASEFDMWKGEFVTSSSRAPEAGGEVKINYIKGQKSYMVNVNVYGLNPQKAYQAWLMTSTGYGGLGPHTLLGYLTVNEEGYGRYFNNRISPCQLNLDKDKIRVVIYELPRTSGTWVLTTTANGAVADGDFQPAGSERGE